MARRKSGRRFDAAPLLLIAVAVALGFSKSAAATPAAPAKPRPPGGPRPGIKPGPAPVPLVNTGGANWRQTRLAALARAGVTGEPAISVLAQWDLETDGGRAEWNFNVGNVRPVPGSDQPRVNLGAVGFFRAYATVDEGVRSYLALVQSGRYTPCWGILQADPTSDDWVRCLGRLGYYCEQAPCPASLLDSYAAGWRTRRAAIAKTQ